MQPKSSNRRVLQDRRLEMEDKSEHGLGGEQKKMTGGSNCWRGDGTGCGKSNKRENNNVQMHDRLRIGSLERNQEMTIEILYSKKYPS